MDIDDLTFYQALGGIKDSVSDSKDFSLIALCYELGMLYPEDINDVVSLSRGQLSKEKINETFKTIVSSVTEDYERINAAIFTYGLKIGKDSLRMLRLSYKDLNFMPDHDICDESFLDLVTQLIMISPNKKLVQFRDTFSRENLGASFNSLGIHGREYIRNELSLVIEEIFSDALANGEASFNAGFGDYIDQYFVYIKDSTNER